VNSVVVTGRSMPSLRISVTSRGSSKPAVTVSTLLMPEFVVAAGDSLTGQRRNQVRQILRREHLLESFRHE